MAFTYHHNRLDAYFPVAVAILDAGLLCSASLPCPAEMGGSIHIHSTASSIIDTVFVCRAAGAVRRRLLVEKSEEIAHLVNGELELLRQGGVRVTRGDARCIAFGHVIRMAIRRLGKRWERSASWTEKLERVERATAEQGGFEAVEHDLEEEVKRASRRGSEVREAAAVYGSEDDEISF